MHGNDRELAILAGASLAVLMEHATDEAAIAALSLSTASFGGARKFDLPMDLQSLAESAIERLSDEKRQRPAALAATAEIPKFDFEKAVAKVREIPSWDGVAQAFTVTAESVRGAMRSFAQKNANAHSALQKLLSIQDEELQMLWWLTGQRSWTYDCDFRDIPEDGRPLVLASELAESTVELPGPRSVRALLSRAGLSNLTRMDIPATINSTRETLLQALVANLHPSPVTTPIHFGILRQLETGGGEAWIAGWPRVRHLTHASRCHLYS